MSNIFLILSFLFAFTGIWYEYLLAQYVNGLLGGGYQVIFFTFTIFASSLGLGSILFNYIPAKLRLWRVLSLVQICVGLISLATPLYFDFLATLLNTPHFTPTALLTLALVPAAILGIATGLEIPFLYYKAHLGIAKILASDYLGMFAGIILYPLLVTSHIPIKNLLIYNSIISIFLGLLLLKFSDAVGKSKSEQSSSFEKQPLLYGAGALAFILSFCSFSYQNLAGKLIIAVIGENLFTQSYTLGFFILGMALGALLVESKKLSAQQAIASLAKVETWICILGALLPLVVYLFSGSFFLFEGTLIQLSEPSLVLTLSLLFSLFPLAIGFLTGMELPLIFKWLNLNSEDRGSFWLIAANYTAAFVAGCFSVFYLAKIMGHTNSFVLIVAINLTALLYIQSKRAVLLSLKGLAPFALIVVSVFLNTQFLNDSQKFFLNTYYSKFSTLEFSWAGLKNTLKAIDYEGSTSRIESFYQNIDLRSTYGSKVEGRQEYFALFLNKQPQFDSLIYENYHESMVAAAKSFSTHTSQNILILGAGDGLLAKVLLDYFPEAKMTLIEIDPEMIRLAKELTPLLNLNHNSLSDPRVEVIVGDAYSYVKTTKNKFDLILIDFPYPTNIDLSRLYSLEFYSGVYNILEPHGLAILDAPINFDFTNDTLSGRPVIVKRLLSTLFYSGFRNPLAFGPFDPFIAIAKDQRQLKIDYQKVGPVKNSVFVNLRDLHHLIGTLEYRKEDVNYVLSPTILGL